MRSCHGALTGVGAFAADPLPTETHKVLPVALAVEAAQAAMATCKARDIVVLRLGRNNGIFYPDASNQELVSAITGASNNAVSRRAGRRHAQGGITGEAQT